MQYAFSSRIPYKVPLLDGVDFITGGVANRKGGT